MRITAIVGSYRKEGVVDSVVDAVLAAAREEGAETTLRKARRLGKRLVSK